MSNLDERMTIHACWSCHKEFSLGEFRDNDGYCPACNAEQDDGSDDELGEPDGYQGENW